ncbi:UNVERIFIED_CONTAM: hypothetical protein GTU68_046731 [Idotea baltica]|nr:hypothetical protein [Idotea baltica]
MGALHQGHLSLIRLAKERSDKVIVSIFVNPKQFNNPDDLKNYPSSLDRDIELLEKEGVDLLYLPQLEEVYPEGFNEEVYQSRLNNIYEGEKRPGHFEGVSTIVRILFDIVNPNLAIFGEKDFQQLTLIKEMVDSLKIPIEILGSETIRDENGLALSSRNKLLGDKDKDLAQKLIEIVKTKYLNNLNLDYLRIVSKDFKDLDKVQQDSRAIIAAYIGGVRLIDNIELNIEFSCKD